MSTVTTTFLWYVAVCEEPNESILTLKHIIEEGISLNAWDYNTVVKIKNKPFTVKLDIKRPSPEQIAYRCHVVDSEIKIDKHYFYTLMQFVLTHYDLPTSFSPVSFLISFLFEHRLFTSNIIQIK